MIISNSHWQRYTSALARGSQAHREGDDMIPRKSVTYFRGNKHMTLPLWKEKGRGFQPDEKTHRRAGLYLWKMAPLRSCCQGHFGTQSLE